MLFFVSILLISSFDSVMLLACIVFSTMWPWSTYALRSQICSTFPTTRLSCGKKLAETIPLSSPSMHRIKVLSLWVVVVVLITYISKCIYLCDNIETLGSGFDLVDEDKPEFIFDFRF
jgi:CDP-diglyceride synthetase